MSLEILIAKVRIFGQSRIDSCCDRAIEIEYVRSARRAEGRAPALQKFVPCRAENKAILGPFDIGGYATFLGPGFDDFGDLELLMTEFAAP